MIETGEGGLILQDGTEGNKMLIKFSGKAKPWTESDKSDFDSGYHHALEYYDPHTGRHLNIPDSFSRAFNEGIISGRFKLIDQAFPKHKMIDWNGGKANVTYWKEGEKEAFLKTIDNQRKNS